ncbi:hypothetical protein PG996_000201 [Apiospora saccharicola]|uniref:Uncharacterized protein n=1 Tax=Apiospora saccharicola TaxID=335842 RepID=A0ABR1WD46_9PEZI
MRLGPPAQQDAEFPSAGKTSCELSQDAKVAFRNAAGAACGFTPRQFHYYLQAPVVKGGYDPGNPRHAVYASTIVAFAADMHAQRLPVEVSVADVPDGLAVHHDDIPPGHTMSPGFAPDRGRAPASLRLRLSTRRSPDVA